MANSCCPPCNQEDCHANANCNSQKKVKDCFATGVQLGVLDFGVVKVFAVFHLFPLAFRRDANKLFRWHVCDFSMVCVNIPITLQIFLQKGGFYDEFGRD